LNLPDSAAVHPAVPAHPLRGVLLAAVLVAPSAASAAADEHEIAIGPGNTYSPSTLTVAAGDTVRWAATTFHPLRFEGEAGQYTTPYSRTLTAPGTLRFFCANHGAQGMTGAITVVAANAAPVIALARETAEPVAGQPVAFRATASDPDGQSVRIDWDLDGDGTFERIDGGPSATASYVAGAHTATARAVDPAGASAQSSVTFTVGAGPGGTGGSGGGPGGTGPAGGDTAAPRLRVAVARNVSLRTLRRRGIRVRLTPSEDGTLAATLRTARRRQLGRATAPARAGERATLRVRARRARPGRLKLRLTATDRAGNRTTVTRTLRVTR
jgi:plastocyanin